MYLSIVNQTKEKFSATTVIEEAAPLAALAENRVILAMRRSHAECFDGMNKAEMAISHRMALLKSFPGLLLPAGPVTAEEESLFRPQNVTWLRFPLTSGDIYAPVNCIKTTKWDRVYRLTHCDVGDLADFEPTPRLIDIDAEQEFDYLVALKWTFRPKDRSMSFLVKLLFGNLDFDRRLFFAEDEVRIAYLDTRLDAAARGVNTDAVGPEPELKPRNRGI
jgi:hypothetical protein